MRSRGGNELAYTAFGLRKSGLPCCTRLSACAVSHMAFFLLLLAGLGGCGTFDASRNPGSAADYPLPLNGMIYDTDNRPVADMQISLDTVNSAKSDINGRFILADVKRGTHSLRAHKEGYEDIELSFNYDNPDQIVYLKARSASELVDEAEKEALGGNWNAARLLLDRRDRIAAPDPASSYLRAVIYYRQGMPAEAAALLRQLAAAGLYGAPVHLFLADILEYELKNPDGAIAELEAYLREKNDPEAQKRLAALKASQATEDK